MPAIRAGLLGRDVLNETIIPCCKGHLRYNSYSFWLKLIKYEKIYICFHIWWFFVIFRVLFVFFAVLSASGCVQKTLDERISEAKGKYVTQSAAGSSGLDPTQDVNPLVRMQYKGWYQNLCTGKWYISDSDDQRCSLPLCWSIWRFKWKRYSDVWSGYPWRKVRVIYSNG